MSGCETRNQGKYPTIINSLKKDQVTTEKYKDKTIRPIPHFCLNHNLSAFIKMFDLATAGRSKV